MKTEFRRLNLALSFTPVEGEPRAHFVVEGQCDLSALVFSFVRPGDRAIEGGCRLWQPRQSAALDPSGGQAELATRTDALPSTTCAAHRCQPTKNIDSVGASVQTVLCRK